MRDQLILTRALTRALVDVGVDACSDPFGGALPLTPAPFTDPSVLANLLQAHGVTPWPVDERPERIRETAREAPSSNCRNSVLTLDWANSAGADAPASIFVKQPSPDRPTRVFANLIGFWKIECAVCRHLSRQLPIASPRIWAVDERRSRFVIVMEDLATRPSARLFVNRAMLEGIDIELARRCVRTLAKLHAGFEGWPSERREAALPLALHPFLSPSLEPIMLAVNRLAVPRCAERSNGMVGDSEATLAHRAFAHWPALQRAWYGEPWTLVHGDSHIGNFFEVGGELGMLDFQGAHWGRGTRDVAYFLMNSMRADVLAEHERSIVETYCEARAEHGAPLDPETAWHEYRGFSFQTLMTSVVSLGLGSFTDSDAVIDAMLERSVAAVRRLRFADWLDEAIDRDASAHEGLAA